MKEKKQIHTGLCITDDRIVATTAHIENKTMIITDAMEMKRSSTIDEDIAEFINTYNLEEGEYSIVACIPTEMTMASFDPHDFDVKEFIKWNIEDTFNFGEHEFELDACRREYPRHNYYLFLAAVDRHELELLRQGIRDTCAPVDTIDCWPLPVTYGLMHRTGTVTGIVEPAGMHLWAWWKDTCVKECIVKVNGADISSALIEMEEMLQRFGVEEIQGIHFYNTDDLNEEQRIDISALQEVYGNTEYIPMMFLGRGRTRCTLGELDWDKAIGMATRGLRWIGQGW